MTEIDIPDLPIPAGAVAGDWCDTECVALEDAFRFLTWSRHDASGVVVAVGGMQFGDGHVERNVTLLAESRDVDLTAAGARWLAAALLNAADALERPGRL
ncbi:hypothetical protein [Mycobacterium sp. 050134]|uniref:hypothetical protein n=1 Tax=Mycobacterium sp. 050134 TaxID=3096111 RepID=UPI002ED8C11B